jgi:hypothetical protein
VQPPELDDRVAESRPNFSNDVSCIGAPVALPLSKGWHGGLRGRSCSVGCDAMVIASEISSFEGGLRPFLSLCPLLALSNDKAIYIQVHNLDRNFIPTRTSRPRYREMQRHLLVGPAAGKLSR